MKPLLTGSGLAALAVAAGAAYLPPEEYVNTLGGTKSKYDLSHGNILPESLLPWSFNGWTAMSNTDSSFWFSSDDARFYGIRCTHQPSPWIGDWGSFRINANLWVDGGHEGSQDSAYSPAMSTWRPYYFNTTLLSYGNRAGFVTVEMAPTNHGALLRWRFPPVATDALSTAFNQTRRIFFNMDGGGHGFAVGAAPNGLTLATGVSTQNQGGVPSNWGHYWHATLAGGDDEATPVKPVGSGGAGGANGYLDFDAFDANTDTIVIRVATSLISPAQAAANAAAEVDGLKFDAAVAAAKAVWNAALSRVAVADVGPGYTDAQTADLLTTFYSSLYRAAKYPRSLAEVDAATGATVHYSPYNGKTLPGPMRTDVGFWDAYRTTTSLLSLWNPAEVADMMEGWLNAWREGGWVPQWSSPAYRASMVGTYSDVTMSEAIVKLPHCGSARAAAAGYCVNASGLYAASRQNAFNTNAPSYGGRACLSDYIQYGYLPSDGACDAATSRTQTYYHADWALSKAATVLGETTDAAALLARANSWNKLLDPATGFFRNKNRAGAFAPTFDEFAWGPSAGFTEAGAWQYRVEVPYDPQGLKAGFAAIGVDACDVVQQLNTLPGAFHNGGYGDLIHEQTEMSSLCWGQWELNNQPVWAVQHMQIGFDTSVTGKCAGQAQGWLRKSTTLYKPGADMFCGDEDNGSMGAWHILNAIGLYPLSPASGDYVLGSPLFANVTIAIDGTASPLIISAVNQGPLNAYVQGVTWNGMPVTGVYVAYADLMAGGVLEFTMGPAPASPDAVPVPL